MFYFLCGLSATFCNKFLNLFASWHHAESTLAGSDKRCACVCEGKHFHQVLVGEVFQTVLQNIVQDAGTEGVSGTCGLNGVLLKEWSAFYAASLIISAASVFTHGDKNQRNVIFLFDQCSTLVVVCGIERSRLYHHL